MRIEWCSIFADGLRGSVKPYQAYFWCKDPKFTHISILDNIVLQLSRFLLLHSPNLSLPLRFFQSQITQDQLFLCSFLPQLLYSNHSQVVQACRHRIRNRHAHSSSGAAQAYSSWTTAERKGMKGIVHRPKLAQTVLNSMLILPLPSSTTTPASPLSRHIPARHVACRDHRLQYARPPRAHRKLSPKPRGFRPIGYRHHFARDTEDDGGL